MGKIKPTIYFNRKEEYANVITGILTIIFNLLFLAYAFYILIIVLMRKNYFVTSNREMADIFLNED